VEGTVKTVESSAFTKISTLGIEEQRVHVIVTVPNPPPELGDAYRVQGRIVVWTSPNAIQIPIGSLVRFGNDWGCYAVVDGRARRRLLKIDHRNDDVAEVVEGVKVGDVVIVHPGDDVGEGVRVGGEGLLTD
jgi:HlyD family secretion protein